MISSLIGSFGTVGALVWFFYHTITKTIPSLTEQYTKNNEKNAENFANAQRDITANFANTLKEEREYRRQEINALQMYIENKACKYNQDHNIG